MVVAPQGGRLNILGAQGRHGAADGESLLQLQECLLDVVWSTCAGTGDGSRLNAHSEGYALPTFYYSRGNLPGGLKEASMAP